jgi:hypothetical protein
MAKPVSEALPADYDAWRTDYPEPDDGADEEAAHEYAQDDAKYLRYCTVAQHALQLARARYRRVTQSTHGSPL